jgi:hypothetical protein
MWLLVVIASGLGVNLLHVHWNFTNTGALGDSFGPLSAIFASVAALSAIESLREQREALRHQAQHRSDDVVSQKNTNLEQTFFKLIELFRDVVNSIDIKRDTRPDKEGQDAFEFLAARVRYNISQGTSIKSSYEAVYRRYRNDLGHYFRLLYNIIDFVDKWDNPKKYFYVKIVRAILSESELILISLNCCYGEGVPKFKGLIEKYALLNNLSNEAVENYNLKNEYNIYAFIPNHALEN